MEERESEFVNRESCLYDAESQFPNPDSRISNIE
jgi:hypothetical protein